MGSPMLAHKPTTLADLLFLRAEATPDLRLFTFLPDAPDAPPIHKTVRDLAEDVRALAGRLQADFPASSRMLLLFPNDLDYVTAFCACLAAGMVAMPAQSPRVHRAMPRLEGTAADAQVACALTNAALRDQQASLCLEGGLLARVP